MRSMSRMSVSSTTPFHIHIFVAFSFVPNSPIVSSIFFGLNTTSLSLPINLISYLFFTISHTFSPNNCLPTSAYLLFFFILPIYLSIYVSIYLSIYLPIHLSMYLSLYFCVVFLHSAQICFILFYSVRVLSSFLSARLLFQSSIKTSEL